MSRRHRRRHRRQQGEVELNLAAMLDMAFQLLAFFIFTFRPSPVEGQLALHMPPFKPISNVSSAEQVPSDSNAGVFADNSFVLTVHADDVGTVSAVNLDFSGPLFEGPANEANLRYLDGRLRDIFGSQGTPFDQVVIRSAPRLRYEELMKIIDVCLRQRMPDGQLLSKLSLMEMAEPGQ
ncbi:MAG: biopolymer transporter ExbD [Planctomycetaceae bacterium]